MNGASVPLTLHVSEGGEPIADITLGGFESEAPVEGSHTQVLDIGNIGTANLDWAIDEAEAVVAPETVRYAYTGRTEFHAPQGFDRASVTSHFGP